MQKREFSNVKPPLEVSSQPLFRHRPRSTSRGYPPTKTTIAAIIMLLVGGILFIAGLSVYFDNTVTDQRARDGAIPMIALGGTLLLPGSYASYILYGSWKGWRGFDYSQIPSYDDE